MAKVRDVGERSLIELMIKYFTPMPDIPVPFWDDVMAVNIGDRKTAVMNTDMLVWKTDVPQGMTHFQAARKAVVMNFSDLGAKGVRPLAFLASIGIPSSLDIEACKEIAKGFEAGAREYGGYVIGGDTNEAEDIIISGVAFGISNEDQIVQRKGAEPDDILATTGHFGDTASAFKLLLEGFDAPSILRETLLESVYMPKAKVKEGVALAETGCVSSCIDSSDGMAISLYDLSRSSEVGFRLDRIPVSPYARHFAELNGLNPFELALYGGEEYELIFTFKPNKMEFIQNALKQVDCELVVLGKATTDRRITYIEEGSERDIRHGGWEHFKKSG